MKPRLTPTARDLLRSLRGAPGGVAEHRFFSGVSTARQLEAVARALLDLERRGLIRKLAKKGDPSPGARETVWVSARHPATGPSPAPWAVSSGKGAFYIHPDRSPGVIAKVYRKGDARLVRVAPELLRGARWLLAALEQGDGDACGAVERYLRRAVRQAARGPP